MKIIQRALAFLPLFASSETPTADQPEPLSGENLFEGVSRYAAKGDRRKGDDGDVKMTVWLSE